MEREVLLNVALGVKGSQVQILLSRQGCQRPADLEFI
jgi:hypothetical protein